ncbi:O-antigen polymerase [Acinetobacter cumulans]|uniref:O-antigen polymerase n=1 Tax=Acinetobacter cumulans TaxID=2136182 RepID=UPI00139116DE|nr:O-antigen polymerase [Acinetobacter cumulans]
MKLIDFKILITLSILFFFQSLFFILFYYYDVGFLWLPPFLYLISGALYIFIRGNIKDPTGILLIGSGLYVFLPTIDGDFESYLRWGFKFSDAYYVSNISALSLLAGTLIFLFMKPRVLISNIFFVDKFLINKIMYVGAILSIFLSVILVVKNGFLFLQSANYLAGFESRGQAGMGFLMLALPLAMISATIYFLREDNAKNKFECILVLLPYILIFMATAQRRYFIIPFMIFIACKLKITIKGGAIALISTLIVYYIFLYLGYLRINEIDLNINDIVSNFDDFNKVFPDLIAGETLLLYATQGASKTKIIESLPLFGDYFLAPLMSFPNFLFGTLFTPLNTKFSEYVTPLIAAQGGGWGFAYSAEGYISGGEFGVILSSLLVCFIFRLIWIYSYFENKKITLMKIFCICSLFTALFFYRNAFAYLFKDLLYVAASLIFLVIICKVYFKSIR